MAPHQLWANGPLVENTAPIRTIKRYEDPNDQPCHGWGCYTSAGQAGIIFMSIIVPIVLFMVFWFAVMRPILDNRSLSDYSDLEPVQPPPPPPPEQPVEPPPPANPPQIPAREQPPKKAPAPSPEQPAQPPPPPPPEPEPSSPPPKEKTPEQSPLKVSTAAAAGSAPHPAPAPAVQSPTVVLNFNVPMSNPFASPSAAPVAPEEKQPAQKQVDEPAQKPSKQQAQQPTEQVAEEPVGEQPGEPAGHQFEQPPVHQTPFPQPVPGDTQMPFAPSQSFPPGQPFPPGIPYQPPQQPGYFPGPQFIPFIPPPPPPLDGRVASAGFAAGHQPFPGPPGLSLTNQMPQITTFGPPVVPPGFQVNLTQMANPEFRGQPDSPTTFETSCSTAQQSMLSRTRHPPPGRARTISDPRTHRSSSDNSRPASLSEITLPSETSIGITNVTKQGQKHGYRIGGHHETTKPRKTDAYVRHEKLRRPNDTYQRRPEGRYRPDVEDVTVRRVRPVRRDTSRSRSRSRSPDSRRSRHSRPVENKKPSRLRFLAPLIPIALGALGVVAEAEAKKHRDRAQSEAYPQREHNPNKRRGDYRQKENRRPARSHETDTRRRDRGPKVREIQQRKRPMLEHTRRGHNSSEEGDDGSSGSTAFWRFRDSGSFRGERV